MEVHSHTHTERKKFTHYLWEFLMLFLAVFCGFLAENLREHMVEQHRAKEYIKSFVEDLKTDTATCVRLLDAYQNKRKALLVYDDCYDSLKKNLSCFNCTGALLQATSSFPDFINADRTLQQLKSAGGLRLLNKEDADSISLYDAEIRQNLQGERTSFQEVQTDLRSITSELLDYNVLRFFTNPKNNSAALPTSSLLFTNNRQLLSKYFVAVYYYLESMNVQVENILKTKAHAKSLILFLEKKYQLK